MTTKIPTRKIITQNLYAGEKALRSFKSDFPYIRSNIKYNLFIDKHKNNSNYSDVIPKLKGKSPLFGFMIFQMRMMYGNAPDKLKFLSSAVKATKTAGCNECSILMHDKLKKMGVPAKNIRLYVEQKNGFDTTKNHAFTVIGMDKKADITNPKTWGKNAVIVDGWTNMVKRVQDGIDYFKEIFRFDPETEVCKFQKYRTR